MQQTHLRQAKARLGEKAGKYTLESLIDIGGMAAVYRAKRWRTEVAVKVMHRDYCRLPEAVVRFARESYAANRIQHPDVVKVLDDGALDDGTPYFVMELLYGVSLEQRLSKRASLPEHEVTAVAESVADVLAAAHAAGVIHRDIKPGNIFLTTDGTVKVLDFGLARLLDGNVNSTTRTGTIIGTASYMSPEQALRDPKAVDPRTDIWSLGAVMFRALAGRTVHGQTAQGPALIAAATQKAPPLAAHADVEPQLAAIVDVALAFKKDHRFDDAASMKAALRALRQGGEPTYAWRTEHADPDQAVDSQRISVSYSAPPSSDGIIVSFEDEDGKSEAYALKPKEGDSDGFEVELLDEPFEEET